MVVIPFEPPPSPDIVPGSVGVLCGLLTVVAQALGRALDGVEVPDVRDDAVDGGGSGNLQLLVASLEVLDVPLPSLNDHIAETGLDHLGQGQETVAKHLESLGKRVSEHSCSVQPLVALIALKQFISAKD